MQSQKILLLFLLIFPAFLLAQEYEDEMDNLALLIQRREYDKADQYVAKLELKYPNDNQLMHFKGRLLYNEEKYEDALKSLEQSLKLGLTPKWVTGWNYVYLGMCHGKLKNIDEAKKYLQMAIQTRATQNIVKTAAKALSEITGEKVAMPVPLVGTPAPAFELRGLDNRVYGLSDFKGEILFLEVGATW